MPYFAQDDGQCGPASLAMVLDASGLALTPQALRPEVFVPAKAGAFAPELLATARRHGRLALQLDGTLESVLREVAADNPVLVLQNLGLAVFPVWHYAVVTGYDLQRDRIMLHSGPQEDARMSLETFERTWARGGHWAMVAVQPERLPATAPAGALADAAAALERVDPGAARRAYAALVERAPSLYGAWIGLGNTALAQADTAAARAAFEQATRLDPDRPEGWNNFAESLLRSGDLTHAQAAIEHALALGGAQRPVYEQTARDIAAARGARAR